MKTYYRAGKYGVNKKTQRFIGDFRLVQRFCEFTKSFDAFGVLNHLIGAGCSPVDDPIYRTH